MIRIVLAGDPVAKGRPRFSRKTGHTYTPEKTRRYEDQLAWAAQVEMAGRPLLEGPLRLTFLSFIGVPASKSKKWREAALCGEIMPTGRPDWENLAKVIDALNRIVWADDSQIVSGQVHKRYSDRPRTEITVGEQKITKNEIDSFWG